MTPRILILDIETPYTQDASYGFIMAASYMWYGENKVYSKVLTDFPRFKISKKDDKELLKWISSVWEQATHVVAHYGDDRRFDKPFINTRLLINKMTLLPENKFLDTWKIARDKLYLRGRSLRKLIGMLGTKTQKPEVSPETWIDAIQGDLKAYEILRHRNAADVKSLGEVFKRLYPLWSEKVPSAHVCGNKYLIRNGYRVCDKSTYQRLFCKKCGSWFKGSIKKDVIL